MKYFLAFCLMLMQITVVAHKIISYNYTKKDGVLSNTVYAIYRSSEGYLWVATDRGISRYNGYEFKHYTLKDGLADIENFFFYEDRQHRLWIGSYNGKLSYIKNNRIFNEQNDQSLRNDNETPITTKIIENKDSSIIICYSGSSRVLLYNNEGVKHFDFNDKTYPGFGILEITYSDNGRFAVKTPDYDYVFDRSEKIISKTKTMSRKILRAQNGNSLVEFDAQKKKVLIDGIAVPGVYPLLQYTILNCVHRIGTCYYFGTDNGLAIIDLKTPERLIHAFDQVIISSITEDITGSIWVSSLTNGIYQIPKDYQQISFADAVYATQILNAAEANHTIYVQDFKNNITRIHTKNLKTDRIKSTYLQQANGRARLLPFQNELYVLIDSFVLKEGRMFKKIYYPILHKKAIANNTDILLNHGYYVNLCNASFETIHRYTHNGDRIFDIAINDHSAFYSTIDSVFRLSDTNSVALHSKHFHGLKSFFVWQQIVIGITHQSELKVVDLTNDNLLFYRREILSLKQLANDKYVYVSDKNSFLLQLTIQADGRLTTRVQIIRKDLIPQDADFLLFSNKHCYIFYDNNLISFSDSLLESATISNPISVQSVNIENKSYPVNSNIVVSENKASSLSLQLKALFFEMSNPEYHFSVVDDHSLDTLWSPLKNDVIDIYNISAGKYTLLIRNEFNEISRLLALQITKPLYKRPEIIMLFFLILFLIAISIFYRIVRTNKMLNSLEQKTLIAEYKSLNAVLNPHFIFNTLSSLQVLIRENKNLIAEKYLLMLSSLMRLNMKNGIKEKVTLAHEMDFATKYLTIEKLRFKERFDFHIQMQENIDSEEIFLPPLSIQPIVENSIKHGLFHLFDKPGLITIDLSRADKKINIIVTDNGRGVQQKEAVDLHSKRVHALDVIRKRFGYFKKLYNIDISLSIANIEEEGSVVGTKVMMQIDIPLGDRGDEQNSNDKISSTA